MVHNEETFDRSHTQTISLRVYQLRLGYAPRLLFWLTAGTLTGGRNVLRSKNLSGISSPTPFTCTSHYNIPTPLHPSSNPPPIVIKHPMDLQSMGKKVRQRFYTTKKQFSDDLYLIWENCLTYNSDPVCGQLPHKSGGADWTCLAQNHLLRRFARNMKTQTDHVLARIPDRRERTMESLIETFKFEPKPVPKPQIITPSSPPNVNHVPRQVSDDSSPLAAPTPTPLTNGKASHSGPLTEVSKASGDIIVPKQDRLKYRPTLERTAEGMSLFTSLDAEMDAYIAGLSTRGALPSRSPSMVIDSSGLTHELLDHRLHTIIEEDDELAMWKEVPVDGVAEGTVLDGREEEESDLSDLEGELAEPGSKKRKRCVSYLSTPPL